MRASTLIAVLFLLPALLAAPLAAEAQQAGKVPRIGFLGTYAGPSLDAFRQVLRELGWVEGQNIVFDYRFAEGRLDRLTDLAVELVRLKVDIIVAEGTQGVAATKNATETLILGDPMFFGERTRIVELATQRRLPLMSNQSEFPEAGGLLAYGTYQRDSFRRAAIYVDKILKGAKPADLPVEQATKLELIVNVRAAKSLGVTVSPTVLARADRLIE